MHSMVVSPEAAAAAVGDAVGALVGSVSAGAVRDLTHDQLSDLVCSVRRDLARLEAVELEAIGEVDARGSHGNDGALTAAAWLRMLTRATPAEATGRVRTARVLRTGVLPHTRAALADGAISGRHAQVIAGGVVDAPAGAVELIEPEAVAAAAEADVRAVANLMRAFRHALDPDEADKAAIRRYQRAGITLSPDPGRVAGHQRAGRRGHRIDDRHRDRHRRPPGPRRRPGPRPGAGSTDWPTSPAATSPTPTPPAAAAAATRT